MDVNEFGAALVNEYFVNETHAIRILESCYGGPTNWSSILWTKDESGTNNTNTTTTLLGDSSPGASDPSSEVLGMTIFWILLPLCLACVYHPLTSGIHNRPRFRMYLHVSPLFCFLDVAYMVLQYGIIRQHHRISWRRAVEVVVKHRLNVFLALPGTRGTANSAERRILPTVEGEIAAGSTTRTVHGERDTIVGSPSSTIPGVVDASSDITSHQSSQPDPGIPASPAPTDLLAQASLNLHIRLIADAFNVILYAKMCGFSGIIGWSIIAECFFDCWLVMELFLFVGYYAAPRMRAESPDDPVETACLDILTAQGGEFTPTTESSALTPLFVELSVSFLPIYRNLRIGLKIQAFCEGILSWLLNEPTLYLLGIPLDFVLSIPHPFIIPAVPIVLIPAVAWFSISPIFLGLAIVSLMALPVSYSLAMGFFFGACRRLARRYYGMLGISDTTLSIVCARVLVAVICTHYCVYFLWFYESEGTKKASWTEMLGRRLG